MKYVYIEDLDWYSHPLCELKSQGFLAFFFFFFQITIFVLNEQGTSGVMV